MASPGTVVLVYNVWRGQPSRRQSPISREICRVGKRVQRDFMYFKYSSRNQIVSHLRPGCGDALGRPLASSSAYCRPNWEKWRKHGWVHTRCWDVSGQASRSQFWGGSLRRGRLVGHGCVAKTWGVLINAPRPPYRRVRTLWLAIPGALKLHHIQPAAKDSNCFSFLLLQMFGNEIRRGKQREGKSIIINKTDLLLAGRLWRR